MADAEVQGALRYSAFISYSHKDAAFARRLHRQLEAYRLPRRVAAGHSGRLTSARRLRPLFRDREEFAAAPDLTTAVQEAIADSSYLIVICSKNSEHSDWVGREVALFRHHHGPTCILAALTPEATDSSLPNTLALAASPDLDHLPLAADFRPQSDGPRLALLKLVAVLAGVRLDELAQRDAQRRIRQITYVTGGALAGMALMSVLTIAALNARAKAEHERARGETLIEFVLTDLRGRLKQVGRLDLLDVANKGALAYYRDEDLTRLSDAGLMHRAELLQAIGEDDEQRGNYADALAQFNEAMRMTNALNPAHGDFQATLFSQAQSEFWVAEASWRVGDYAQAELHFKLYAVLAQRLIAASPHNPLWQMEVGYAQSNLGMFIMCRRLDLAQAEPHLKMAMDNFLEASRQRPSDADIKGEIADGYGWLGELERLRQKCDAALKYRTQQKNILDELLSNDWRNAEIRNQLITNKLALARVDVCRGEAGYATALEKFNDALHDAIELVHSDPNNVDAVTKVRAIELFKVRTWMAMPAMSRPPATTIAALLGDCDADARIPHNIEIVTFCAILKIRWLARNGDRPKATEAMAKIRNGDAFKGDKLSNRWQIDMSEEARWALSEN
jgi:tetratricopeptide (TPR) repeat protein